MEYPRHVTIIMDGNGRWAGKQGKQRLLGHNAGVESVRSCCEYAARHGIEYLSIYAFSEENWARPEGEVSGLMKIMVKAVKSEADTFMKNNMRFLVIGNRNHLPSDVLEAADELQRRTSGNTGTTTEPSAPDRETAFQCIQFGRIPGCPRTVYAGAL